MSSIYDFEASSCSLEKYGDWKGRANSVWGKEREVTLHFFLGRQKIRSSNTLHNSLLYTYPPLIAMVVG